MELFALFEKWRQYRSEKLAPLGKFLFKIGLNAFVLTSLALFCGLAAVYFLFSNLWLFILFGLLHLLLDALDGVVARVSQETYFGKLFDFCSDLAVSLLLLLKIGFFSNDYFPFLVLALALLTQMITLISKFEYKSLGVRTFLFFFLALQLPVVAYLVAGIFSLFSLALQLKLYLDRRII